MLRITALIVAAAALAGCEWVAEAETRLTPERCAQLDTLDAPLVCNPRLDRAEEVEAE